MKILSWIYVIFYALLTSLSFGLSTYTQGLNIDVFSVLIFNLLSLALLIKSIVKPWKNKYAPYLFGIIYIIILFKGTGNIYDNSPNIFFMMLVFYIPLPLLSIVLHYQPNKEEDK